MAPSTTKNSSSTSNKYTHLCIDHSPHTARSPAIELRLVEHVRSGRNVSVCAPGNLCGQIDLTHTDNGFQPTAQTSVAGTDLKRKIVIGK